MKNEKLNDVIQKMVSEIEILKEERDGIRTIPYFYYHKPLHRDTGIYFCIEFWDKYLNDEYLWGYWDDNHDVVESNMDIIEKMDWKIPDRHFYEEDFYLECLSLYLEKELFPICDPDEGKLLVRSWLRRKSLSWFEDWFDSNYRGIDVMYPFTNSWFLTGFERDYSLNRWWEEQNGKD